MNRFPEKITTKDRCQENGKQNTPQERGVNSESAESLRQLRRSKNLTIMDVSAYLGKQTVTVEMWESGFLTPSAAEVVMLACVYGCSIKRVYKALLNTPVR